MGECDVDLRQCTNIAVGISVIESVFVCVRSQFTFKEPLNTTDPFTPKHYTEFYLAC